jgi:serine/threonine protein kinase
MLSRCVHLDHCTELSVIVSGQIVQSRAMSCSQRKLVQVFGLVVMEDGCPGIVMEYLASTLLSLLDNSCKVHHSVAPAHRSVIPYDTLRFIGFQIFSVLAHLHEQNVRLLFHVDCAGFDVMVSVIASKQTKLHHLCVHHACNHTLVCVYWMHSLTHNVSRCRTH